MIFLLLAGLAHSASAQQLTATVNPVRQIICSDENFSPFNFGHTGITIVGTVSYQVVFESGDAIVEFPSGLITTGSSWTPTVLKPGKAQFRVIPWYRIGIPLVSGEPATFTLEVRENLAKTVVMGHPTYRNGDQVPAMNLQDLLPELPAGATVSWTNSNPDIGLPASGEGVLPAFVAKNTGTSAISGDITFTFTYFDGPDNCKTSTATRTITVNPRTNLDRDLVAKPVSGQIICFDKAFTEIPFVATDRGANVTGARFRVEFVSGEKIFGAPTDLVEKWRPVAAKAGKAVFRVTPVYENREGVAATFSLEARPNLENITLVGNLTFNNGDQVQAINLDASLPEGAKISWTIDDQTKAEAIGMQASGEGVISPFTATNTGDTPIEATIKFILKYIDGKNGKDCPFETTRTITVKPRTNLSYDLIAKPVNGQIICYGEGSTEKFDLITFGAFDMANEGKDVAGNYFRVEFVSGDPILNLSAELVGNSWTPPSATRAGKALYRVTPVYQGRQGVPVVFSLEARASLAFVASVENLIFQNGDLIQSINMNASLPEGAKISWTNTNTDIGLPPEGNGFIPPFTATNTGDGESTADIEFILQYIDGEGCKITAKRTITVMPKTHFDYDLVAKRVEDQIICYGTGYEGTNFPNIPFSATDRNNAVNCKFRVKYVSGDAIALPPEGLVNNSWKPVANRAGKGVYSVTPVYRNREGAPVNFSLEARASLAFVAAMGDLTLRNGDLVQAINLNTLLPENAIISWTIPAADAKAIGMEASGAGVIPPFTATNTNNNGDSISAVITFTLKYTDFDGCTISPKCTITVAPKTNLDYDLAMDAIAGKIICYGEGFNETFPEIPFSAVDKRNSTTPAVTGPYFRVEFVSGENIFSPPAGLVANWKPVATKAGKALYRVTPVYQNREGISTVFNLEARASLAYVAAIKDLIFWNGDQVQSINLNALLPAGAKISWKINSEEAKAIGMPPEGDGVIPPFTATNITGVPIPAEITFTLQYIDGATCPIPATQTITVKPRTLLDRDLIADPVPGQIVCYKEDFDLIPFSAFDTISRSTVIGPHFRVEFVGGDNIFNPPAGLVSSWTPIRPTFESAGKAVYRVVPVYNNREGVAATFSLEARPSLENIALVGNLMFQNGDPVQSIDLNSLMPEGAVISWENSDTSIGLGKWGTGFIPQFTATNTGNTPITAILTFTLKYIDGKCDFVGESTVTVNPKTNLDRDLVADTVSGKTVCFGDPFPKIIFGATDRGANVADASFRVEFVSGDNIFDAPTGLVKEWTPSTVKSEKKAGKAVYRAVPVYNNREGVAATFSLEARVNLANIAAIENLTFQNGDQIQAINLNALLPSGAKISWVIKDAAKAAAIGMSTSGDGEIPPFRATNTTNAPISAEITFTLRYTDDKACSVEATRTITVNPKTNFDYDVVMEPIESRTICYSTSAAAFGPISLEAVRTAGAQPPFAVGDSIAYLIEFAGGVDILDLITDNHNTARGTISAGLNTLYKWTPTIAIATGTGRLKTGKGTYRVTPRWNNSEGKSVEFTLEHYPELNAATMIDVKNMVFSNGDQVDAYTFKGVNLPSGASITWQRVAGLPVGTPESGVDRIPAFLAVNTTSRAITARYEVRIQFGNCSSSNSNSRQFDITVNPRTIDDADLLIRPVAGQTICYDGRFANIELLATHRFTAKLDSVHFQWDLIDGVDLLGLGTTNVIQSPDSQAVWNIRVNPDPLVVGSGTYRITPIRKNNAGISSVFTLTRLPAASVNPVSDLVLCNNSELPLIRFTGSANTQFDWVVFMTNAPGGGSLLGLPPSGTNEIAHYRLVNRTRSHITETIRVIPRLIDSDGNSCNGNAIAFSITVLPSPAIDPVADVLAQSGEAVAAIPFTGAVTSCRWQSSNPNVNADLRAPSRGEGKFFPGFTTANITNEIIRSTVTVTPVYSYGTGVNALVCEGEPTEFFIITGPIPFIEPLENIRVGEGETTGEFIPLRLPSGSGYHLEWKVSDSRIGLESYTYTPGAAERKTIPGLKPAAIFPDGLDEPAVVTVTVTPLLTAGSTTFRGAPVDFTITVVPRTRLQQGFEESIETEQYCCIGEPVMLEAKATGYGLKYQWYRNHLPIPGADRAVYAIDRAAVEHSGDYYATVAGEDGSLRSKTWQVTVKPNVVSQRWNDVLVLNTNPADNGGYDFTDYQWYSVTSDGVTAKLPGETRSYLYVTGGLVSSLRYYVEAVTGDGHIFQSCPVAPQPATPQPEILVYPNPVHAGGYVTVEIHATGNATVVVQDITGKAVSQTKATGEITQIKVPNITGIYILEVVLEDAVKSFKIIVL